MIVSDKDNRANVFHYTICASKSLKTSILAHFLYHDSANKKWPDSIKYQSIEIIWKAKRSDNFIVRIVITHHVLKWSLIPDEETAHDSQRIDPWCHQTFSWFSWGEANQVISSRCVCFSHAFCWGGKNFSTNDNSWNTMIFWWLIVSCFSSRSLSLAMLSGLLDASEMSYLFRDYQ